MNWLNKRIWKQSVASTFICLVGCSVGAIGMVQYLSGHHWMLVLFASIVAGFLSCMAVLTIWQIVFNRMGFGKAVISSFKMSLTSILIMIITEIMVIFVMAPQFFSDQVQANTIIGFNIMLFAMFCGFVLSLPFNYYQLHVVTTYRRDYRLKNPVSLR